VTHQNRRKLILLQEKIARLERQIASELKRLPGAYGFADVQSFVRSVVAAAQTNGRHRQQEQHRKVRHRAIITRGMRMAVKGMTKEGRTEAEIARALAISPSSVHNIKKSSGLVKRRT
jgi:DNA-binding CsgD family transcriptional regulator